MSDLLPCPFCGGEARVARVIGRNYHKYYSGVCDTKGCRGSDPACFCETEEEAVGQWNTRAENTCHIERVESTHLEDTYECDACGWRYTESIYNPDVVFKYCPNCKARVVD